MADSSKKPFIEHVHELRQRLFWWAVSLFAGGLVGFQLKDVIQEILVRPLNQPLYYTSPTGGFDFLFKICLFFAILVSLPVLMYHLLRFLEPTIARRTRFLFIKLITSSILLASAGVSFAYFVSLPSALHFLGNFGSDSIQALISTDTYFSFVMVYLAGFAALFQLPLLMYFINRAKPLNPKGLMKKQRYVIAGSFIAAAILTPTPDPMNQLIMAGPMVLLYQASVVMIWLVNRRRNHEFYNDEPKPASPARPELPKSELLTASDAPDQGSEVSSQPAVPAVQPSRSPSRHTLALADRPFIEKTPRPAAIASTVPAAVWKPRPAAAGGRVITLAEQPSLPVAVPARERHLIDRPKSLSRGAVDLSAMKYQPLHRPSRYSIDMRPGNTADGRA